MSDTELFPCPFCASNGAMLFHKTGHAEDSGWGVLCGGTVHCAGSVGRHVTFTRDEAIRAWNNRSWQSQKETK
jgi:hypothetical protein